MAEMAEINEISCKVQRRRWNWLGHELRREGVKNWFMVLGWTPEDGGVGGRPKTTWGRTVKERVARQGGRAGMCPRWWHVTGGLGRQCDGLMHLLA